MTESEIMVIINELTKFVAKEDIVVIEPNSTSVQELIHKSPKTVIITQRYTPSEL